MVGMSDRHRGTVVVAGTGLGAAFASAGHANAIETYVYLDSPEDDAFAREVLDVGERTCFLHALCRTG